MGTLGPEQIEWLEDDLKGKSASTPIVVFAHMPLWSVYPQWGWGTDDAAPAIGLSEALRLGHRAQRPHPPGDPEGRGQRHVPHRLFDRLPAGRAPARREPSPGPLKVPAEQLKSMLGVRRVDVVHDKRRHADRRHARCVRRQMLVFVARAGAARSSRSAQWPSCCSSPGPGSGGAVLRLRRCPRRGDRRLHVRSGHADRGARHQGHLDQQGRRAAHRGERPPIPSCSSRRRSTPTTASPSPSPSAGTFKYFCSIHPRMQGTVVVE